MNSMASIVSSFENPSSSVFCGLDFLKYFNQADQLKQQLDEYFKESIDQFLCSRKMHTIQLANGTIIIDLLLQPKLTPTILEYHIVVKNCKYTIKRVR